MPEVPSLNIGATLPGEALVVAIIEAVTENRRTMSQANRDRFDAMVIKSMEDGSAFWSSIFTPLTRAIGNLQKP